MPDELVALFEQFYRANVEAVMAYALSRTRPELAREVVEETFLVAWRRFDEQATRSRPWLIGVARRVLADQRRSQTRRDALDVRIQALVAEGSADPAELVANRLSALRALQRLNEHDRELLCLIVWDDLEPEQVAEVFGCSKAALKVRLHRARRRLAAAIKEEERDDGPSTDVANRHLKVEIGVLPLRKELT